MSLALQVESAPCRASAGPLSYVVAFANGGAKDVTQRYVSSFMATEKLRCGAWWDATLAPLRCLELTGARSAAAHGVISGACHGRLCLFLSMLVIDEDIT